MIIGKALATCSNHTINQYNYNQLIATRKDVRLDWIDWIDDLITRYCNRNQISSFR